MITLLRRCDVLILAGLALSAAVTTARAADPSQACPSPVVAVPGQDRADLIAKMQAGTDRTVLLIGDSIAEHWADADRWLGGPLDNWGVSGDTPLGLLWRLRQVRGRHDWADMVLIVGVNAAWRSPGCGTVAASIESDVKALRRLDPAGRLVVVAVMPYMPGLAASLPQIGPINAQLAADAGRLGYRFVDPGPTIAAACLGRDRCPLLLDWLHPTPAGYAVIGAAVRAALAR